MAQELEDLLGKEDIFSCKIPIGIATIQRFAMAIGDQNPLYWDENFAKKHGFEGIIAPPTLIFELNHNIGAQISEQDGGYTDSFLDMLKEISKRFVRGGNEYEIFQPVSHQDIITMKRKIAQIEEKKGKSGELLIVTIEKKYLNQKGVLLGIDRETMIFIKATK